MNATSNLGAIVGEVDVGQHGLLAPLAFADEEIRVFFEGRRCHLDRRVVDHGNKIQRACGLCYHLKQNERGRQRVAAALETVDPLWVGPIGGAGSRSSADRRIVSQSHSAQLIAHVRKVSRWPVESLADWTRYETVLGGEHVRWDTLRDGALVDRYQGCVATRTAREQVREWIELKGGQNLLQLEANMVTGDEEQRYAAGGTHQAPIARQNDATLGARAPEKRSPGKVCTVGGVLTDEPQPDGESAQHLVDGKALRIHVCCHMTIAAVV